LRTYTLCFLTYWALFAKWHDWQGGLTFASRMLSEGYPLWMPLVMLGWDRLRNHRPARAALVAAGAYSVLYQLANLATFDATTALNTKHLPWTPRDHFFVVHVAQFGASATLKAVNVTALAFVGCAAAFVVLLRPFIRPQEKQFAQAQTLGGEGSGGAQPGHTPPQAAQGIGDPVVAHGGSVAK
jgi:hypothetical protein